MKVTDETAKTFVEHYNYVEPCDHDIDYGFHMESVKEALQVALSTIPKQEPLSVSTIMQIVNAHEGDTIGVVRAIEKAHKIGL